MKNICIIMQCSLPVPAIKGGAVETLVEYIINENEKKHKFNFTIINVYDEKNIGNTNKYKYTKFVTVKKHTAFLNKILLFLYKVLKKVNIYIPFSLEFKEALKILKKMDKQQDFFVYEAGPTTQLPLLKKVVSKEKLLVHLHWDGLGNKKKDKNFKCLIPVSEYISNQWKNKTNRDDSGIRVLYNCSCVENFRMKTSVEEQYKLKKELGIPKDNKVIIFVGRMVKEKGIKELLEAFKIVKSQNISLLIIGSLKFGLNSKNKFEDELKRIIKEVGKQVVCTGYIHQNDLYKYYNISDISVMPSIFKEPAGMVAIEAQASGIPLIASNVGGLPEYAKEGSSILIDTDECFIENIAKNIDMLINNDELRAEMGEMGIRNTEYMDPENYFEEFSKIINNI